MWKHFLALDRGSQWGSFTLYMLHIASELPSVGVTDAVLDAQDYGLVAMSSTSLPFNHLLS